MSRPLLGNTKQFHKRHVLYCNLYQAPDVRVQRGDVRKYWDIGLLRTRVSVCWTQLNLWGGVDRPSPPSTLQALDALDPSWPASEAVYAERGRRFQEELRWGYAATVHLAMSVRFSLILSAAPSGQGAERAAHRLVTDWISP